MKKLVFFALMTVGSAAFAQTAKPAENKAMMTNAKIIEIQSQKMKKDLGLSDDQTMQIATWLVKQEQDRQAIRTEMHSMKSSGQELTAAQKTTIKSKMDTQKATAIIELQNILSPQQYTTWQNNTEAQKAQFENTAPKPANAG